MQGLRSNEGEDFERFFSIVEDEAKKVGSVFFCDTFEGGETSFGDMRICNLGGWLVPMDDVESFESVYMAGKDNELWENDKWYNMYVFLNYSVDGENELTLNFNKDK